MPTMAQATRCGGVVCLDVFLFFFFRFPLPGSLSHTHYIDIFVFSPNQIRTKH